MKTITQEEFNEIKKKHGLHLIGDDAGKRANLSHLDLTGIEFGREANLRGADLRGAYLRGADLRGADLTEADLTEAYLTEANLTEANLRGADLRGADLRGAYLRGAKEIPKSLWEHYAKDIMYVLLCNPEEVSGLRKLLCEGKINGQAYEGECCCLVGSLNNIADNGTVDEFCEHRIPFYTKGTHNLCESWFLNIGLGDTPENSEFSRLVVELIDTHFPEASIKEG